MTRWRARSLERVVAEDHQQEVDAQNRDDPYTGRRARAPTPEQSGDESRREQWDDEKQVDPDRDSALVRPEMLPALVDRVGGPGSGGDENQAEMATCIRSPMQEIAGTEHHRRQKREKRSLEERTERREHETSTFQLEWDGACWSPHGTNEPQLICLLPKPSRSCGESPAISSHGAFDPTKMCPLIRTPGSESSSPAGTQ